MIDVPKSVSCLHLDIGQAIPLMFVVDHNEVDFAMCKYLKLTDYQHLTFQIQLVDGIEFKLVCG